MEANDNKTVRSTCRMCHGVCGVLIYLKGDRVVKVTGDPDCPTSRGYICAKGRASVDLLYHPDRLKFPLRRVGNKGQNKWARMDWNEALDIIANELKAVKREYGIESVAGIQGTGRPYTGLFRRLLNCFGTPNLTGGAHICYFPRQRASRMTCGMLPVCDFYAFGGVYPKCVLVWGCNISGTGASDGMCGYQLTQTIKRGARLIVVDPRRIPIAKKADYWLQIRPGTDGALALGMINVIIRDQLYDKDFVQKWTVGFDKLAERVKDYPPEKVEGITWVPEKLIREAARIYSSVKPACMLWGNAVDQSINSFQTIRALLILRGITGNIDVPGGDVFWESPKNVVPQCHYPPHPNLQLPEEVSSEMRGKAIGVGRFKVLDPIVHPPTFWDAVLSEQPYPIRALFIMGSNPLVTQSNALKVEQGLRKINFVVVSEMFMTPTAQLADIVLPASSWLEQDDIADIHFIWCVLVRQKVAQIGECWDDKQIMIELAKRLGLGEYFPWKNVKEYCNWILKDSGISFDRFKDLAIIKGPMRYRKYEEAGFDTPSRKFELYSSAMESIGYDPLPFFQEPPESPYSTPYLARQYPLIITTGAKIMPFFHSEGRQIKRLRRLNPDPLVEIHPLTAKELGIKDGDWVWIESPRGGRIRQKARLTDGIHPKVVSAQHGWWFPEEGPPEYGWKTSNVNLLTGGMPYDSSTGSEPWRSFLCRIYKAA